MGKLSARRGNRVRGGGGGGVRLWIGVRLKRCNLVSFPNTLLVADTPDVCVDAEACVARVLCKTMPKK